MKDKIHSENTAFFSAASAGYGLYAATSLLTIRDSIPDAKLFIFSSGLTENEKKILTQNNIIYHEINLTDFFSKTWDYPVDCYYIFAGPEILSSLGYEYSVYIDGDILCLSNPLQGLDKIKFIAGVESAPVNGKYNSIFADDWSKIKENWSLSESTASRKRINSGVVYFNNIKMKEIGLLEKTSRLYKKCLELGIPRKGDDSLFSLFQYIYISDKDIKILSPVYNFILQFNEYIYPIRNLVFFHFSIDKPWKLNPYKHKNKIENIYNPYVKMWRKKYKDMDFNSYLKSTNIYLNRLSIFIILFNKIVSKIIYIINDTTLWLKGKKKNIIFRKFNSIKKPIKLFWWQEPHNGVFNFGDEITAELIKGIFGYKSELTSIDKCNMIGAGSILEIAIARNSENIIHVWGSGFIKSEVGIDNLNNLEFHGVRGLKTSSRIKKKDIAIGDPGLLANIIYPRSVIKSDKIGVVVHYIDNDLKIINKFKKDPRFVVIDPLNSPINVAKQISSCKLVLSSSLHGLIFSDSFNIPNFHIKLSNRLTGGIYKFMDYYSGTSRNYTCADLNSIFKEEYLNKLIESYEPIKDLNKLQKNLIESFPKYKALV